MRRAQARLLPPFYLYKSRLHEAMLCYLLRGRSCSRLINSGNL